MPIGYKNALVDITSKDTINKVIDKLHNADVFITIKNDLCHHKPTWRIKLSQTIVEPMYGSNGHHYCGSLDIEVEVKEGIKFSKTFKEVVKKFLEEQTLLPERYEKEKQYYLKNY